MDYNLKEMEEISNFGHKLSLIYEEIDDECIYDGGMNDIVIKTGQAFMKALKEKYPQINFSGDLDEMLAELDAIIYS